MKTKSFLLCALFAFNTAILHSQPTKPLKKVLELNITMKGGANGAAVAWHPVLKRYYAAMAGNISYPLGIFDATGKLVSPDEQATLFDIRGMWYNPNSRTIQMNGYNANGWAEYALDAKGFPTEVKELYTGLIQPGEQSTGAFNPKENVLYFLNEEGNIQRYSVSDGSYMDDISLALGKTKKDGIEGDDNEEALGNYNGSTVIYTGIGGAELGLLNHLNKQVELYNIKTGLLIKKFTFPDDAPVPQFLNFSFSNGIYWLFDKEARIWKGYK